MAGNEVEQATAEVARDLTDRIKVAVEGTWLLVRKAYESRAWAVLGYASWDEYCTREFGTSRIALPREERQEVVASLRESGLSTRAIAAATGISEGSVRNDLQASAQNYAVEPPRVTGVNGKSYAPYRPAPRPTIHQPVTMPTPTPAPLPPPPLPAEPAMFDSPEIVDAEIVDDPAPPLRDPFHGWTENERDLHKRLTDDEETIVVSYRIHERLIAWCEQAGMLVRIDRRSEWGNPFVLTEDGDRGAVIANYVAHYLPYKPSLLGKRGEIASKALACWCAPKPCHGDALKAWADGDLDAFNDLAKQAVARQDVHMWITELQEEAAL
jgi:hypothetical protein